MGLTGRRSLLAIPAEVPAVFSRPQLLFRPGPENRGSLERILLGVLAFGVYICLIGGGSSLYRTVKCADVVGLVELSCPG